MYFLWPMNMSKINPALTEFCKKHNIDVISTNKRRARYCIDREFFTSDVSKDTIIENPIFDTEPVYTVDIPESELDRLCQFEKQVFNYQKSSGQHHYNLFESMMNQRVEESLLRDKFPAVQKAYEQYSLLLKMAKSGQL